MKKGISSMLDWGKLSIELQNMLHLRSQIIGFTRIEEAEDLTRIKGVKRVEGHLFTFCQVPFLTRVAGITVGVTKNDTMLDRCRRIFGLRTPSEKSMTSEAESMATTWFCSVNDGLKQQKDYFRIPVAPNGALVLGPLSQNNFDPEVILIYGNSAQVMMVMCGLQKEKYERFDFSFIGEGACSNSLAQCYATGRPAVSIPCYGERVFGQIADDELIIALPPGELERAISGIRKLSKMGLVYPIYSIGAEADVLPFLSKLYPATLVNLKKDSKKS